MSEMRPSSYDLTACYFLSRHPTVARLPKPRWGPRQLKRVIWLGCVGILFGLVLVVVGMLMLGLVAMNHEHARLAELERRRVVEEEAAKLRQEILHVADLYASSASQSLELAQRIQLVLDTAPMKQRSFLGRMIPEALRLQALHRIPASATLGMAAYESAFGQSDLAVSHHNYFGMKAFDSQWSGTKVDLLTRDLGVLTMASFRSYADFRDGLDGFAAFLVAKPRYREAFAKRKGSEFVAALATAGYCPDLNYSSTVAALIDRHRLALLDAADPPAGSVSPARESSGQMPIRTTSGATLSHGTALTDLPQD
jgi:flagellum-specific peptidoglycan hydrolase FlgJ